MQELWLFKIGRDLIGWSLRPSSNSAQRFIVFKLQVGKHTKSGITFARQSEFIGFPLELYVVISKEIDVTDSENEEVMKDEGGRWAKIEDFFEQQETQEDERENAESAIGSKPLVLRCALRFV